ncbi:MAG: 16S rRNA (adenine(1518)-N(6)/adenine(1519)-N(6))-dimethyltransferase RsmA [Bacillota bacterium]
MEGLLNVASPREVMLLLQRYGLNPRHSLGQNFLIDGNTIKKIISAAAVKTGDAVVEIGPGAGAITVELARCGTRVLALELDRGLSGMLRDLLQSFPSVTVLQEDALKVTWPALLGRYFPAGERIKLVSNLPYYISAPLLYALFEEQFPFAGAVLMFQKEVAQRLIAPAGDHNYGGLSVLAQYFTTGRILFKVSRRAFWPVPGVDSVVIGLKPRQKMLSAEEEALFRQIVRGSFQQRRKTILNNMLTMLPYSRDIIGDLMLAASVKPDCRPETITVDQFANLSRIIYNYVSKTK